MTEWHRGTCFCGKVEIQVSGQPVDMGYCHCASCRAYSGAPLVAFTIWRTNQVELVRGSELLEGFNKVGTSNRRFCSACGGHLLLDHPDLDLVESEQPCFPP